MMKIREPIKLKSLNLIKVSEDIFADKIMGNYAFMAVVIRKEELFHLLACTSGEGDEIAINILNQVINRVMPSVICNLSYQDKVFITCMLSKLGITDVNRFMKRLYAAVNEIELKNHILELYCGKEDIFKNIKTTENPESEVQWATVEYRENYLYRQIYQKLHTRQIYQSVNDFNYIYIPHNGSDISVWYENMVDIGLLQLKKEFFNRDYSMGFHYGNPYESAGSYLKDITKEEIISEIMEASIFAVVKSFAASDVINHTGFGNRKYISDYNVSRIITDTMDRYLYFHQENLFKDSEMVQYMWEKKNDIYSCETQILSEMTNISAMQEILIRNNEGIVQVNYSISKLYEELIMLNKIQSLYDLIGSRLTAENRVFNAEDKKTVLKLCSEVEGMINRRSSFNGTDKDKFGSVRKVVTEKMKKAGEISKMSENMQNITTEKTEKTKETEKALENKKHLIIKQNKKTKEIEKIIDELKIHDLSKMHETQRAVYIESTGLNSQTDSADIVLYNNNGSTDIIGNIETDIFGSVRKIVTGKIEKAGETEKESEKNSRYQVIKQKEQIKAIEKVINEIKCYGLSEVSKYPIGDSIELDTQISKTSENMQNITTEKTEKTKENEKALENKKHLIIKQNKRTKEIEKIINELKTHNLSKMHETQRAVYIESTGSNSQTDSTDIVMYHNNIGSNIIENIETGIFGSVRKIVTEKTKETEKALENKKHLIIKQNKKTKEIEKIINELKPHNLSKMNETQRAVYIESTGLNSQTDSADIVLHNNYGSTDIIENIETGIFGSVRKIVITTERIGQIGKSTERNNSSESIIQTEKITAIEKDIFKNAQSKITAKTEKVKAIRSNDIQLNILQNGYSNPNIQNDFTSRAEIVHKNTANKNRQSNTKISSYLEKNINRTNVNMTGSIKQDYRDSLTLYNKSDGGRVINELIQTNVQSQVNSIADKVYKKIEKKLQIERKRRGL